MTRGTRRGGSFAALTALAGALCLASGLAVAAGDSGVKSATASGTKPAAAPGARPVAEAAPHSATKSSAPAPSSRTARPAGGVSKPAASPSGKTAPRTLDPVHIEGELDVPEVLFITARDQRRIVGFQHGRYLTGTPALARRTPLPSHVVVDRKRTPDAPETAR